MKKILHLLFTVSIIASSSNVFSQLSEVNLNSRVNQSQLIVEGRVISSRSFWDANQYNIYTSHKIEVYKIFKGILSSNTIEVITPGGIVGYHKETVEPSLSLKNNDIGIFILKNSSIYQIKSSIFPQYEPYASVQGFIKYDLNNNIASGPFDNFNDIENTLYSGIQNLTNSPYSIITPFSTKIKGGINNKASSITSFTPTSATAGTATIITITGTDFGASTGTVLFSNADDGGATFDAGLTTEIISWTTTQIVVEVYQDAGTGLIQVIGNGTATSSQTLTVSYAQLNAEFDPGSGTESYQTRHIDRDGSGGYIWQMQTDFDASPANASFIRSLESWRCNTGINWTIGSVTTTDVVANDNINIIRHDNGGELPAGTLGRCTSRWSGCGGATIDWYVEELDIVFDDGTNWNYTTSSPGVTEYDFETVSLHELGHGHQLGHVIDVSDVMYYSVSNGSMNRTPSVNNLVGAGDVQSRSTGGVVCSQTLMANYSCGAAPVAEFSAVSTTLCEGTSTIFTDASTNTPTSWAWVFTPATVTFINSTTATSQNPEVQFNAAGSYQAELTATNASGSDIEIKSGYITVNPLPGAAGSISGSTAECENETGVPYSISAVADATTYVWSVPAGAIVATGQGTINITVDFGIASGNVSVTPNNSCGNGGTAIKAVTISNCTPPPIINPYFCGTTMSQVNQQVYSIVISGATEYEFQLVPQGGGSTINYLSCCSFRLNFAWFSGWDYNKTYDVSVRAKVGGTFTAYGASCPITSPPITLPAIRSGHCGTVMSQVNQQVYSIAIPGATEYEFQLVPQGGGPTINNLSCCSFRLNFAWFSGWTISTTYDVSVRAKVDGIFTAYGTDCPITSPPSLTARYGNFTDNTFRLESVNEIYSNLEMRVYPNPNQGEFVYLELKGISPNAEIIVTDIYGKTILNQPVESDYENYNGTLRFSKNLDAGFYLITVISGDQKITKKLIVR